jgi:biotin carboxyl carrier protein
MSRAFVFAGGVEVAVRGRGPDYEIARDGRGGRARTIVLPDGRLSLLFDDGHQVCGRVLRRETAEIEISTPRGRWRVGVTDPLRARLSAVSADVAATESESEDVRALMPGRIVEVAVAAGDSVAAGALLLVLEAMKMQNELRATHAGIVMRCTAAAGQTVEAGTLLLTIQPNREGPPQSIAGSA